MTRIKICGLREKEALDSAIKYGVHAVGFVFYPLSPRSITPKEAQNLCYDIPPFVAKVGVFVDATLDSILEIAFTTGIDTIQLHNETYNETFVQALKEKWHGSILRAFRTSVLDDATIEGVKNFPAHGILFDTYHPTSYGGTGQTIEYNLSPTACEWLHTKAILAGGIKRENLTHILAYRPYGIDVSSGVEKEKGVKDPRLIRDFLHLFYEIEAHYA